jgi:hypothetical protein
MAKHCDVCNEDYADNLAACPRCAAAKKTQLAGRSDERTTQLVTQDDARVTQLESNPSDSKVSLGDESVSLEAGEASAESSSVTLPAPVSPSASDVALASLMSEAADEEPAPKEPAVSEKEVDELLADLEEVPAQGTLEEAAEIAEGEEAIAAAEAEEAAEAAEVEEEKPAKTVKPRSIIPALAGANIPALAGATVVGILLGVGGTLGARSLMGSSEKERPSAPLNVPQGATQNAPQAKAAPSFDTLAARVASGDWDEAAGIEQVEENNPKQLVARGQYRLGVYLKKAGNKVNPDDPALHNALEDLKKAAEQNEPNALYDLAFIKEMAGKLEEARDEYAKAAQKLANDPGQKQRFESAILRVELKAAAKAAAGSADLPPRGGRQDHATLAALVLIALQQSPAPQPEQQGQPGQQPAATENKEAGFDFWDAIKQARTGKFAEAVSAIDRARKLHDEMRFARLRKAQNPLSDPAEDIFLRCCDELKMYWELEKQLRDGGYLTDKNTPAQAIQALAEKAKSGGPQDQAKDLRDKLTAAEQSQKRAETKAAELEKQIQKSKAENTKLAGDLKAAQKTSEERQADLTSAKQQLEKMKGNSDSQSGSLKKVRDELVAANLLDSNEKADVGEAVKRLIEVAKSRDPQGTLRRQGEEMARLSAALKERWRPQEMLPLWRLLLDENRTRSELARMATMDAQRVLADPQATAAQRGAAEVVIGLALRNTEKFPEARTMLETARNVATNEEWLACADSALKEVSNPAAYFNSQAQLWYDHGRIETALAVLERGMKVLPAQDRGRLLAQRSMIELDAARARVKGPIPPTEPLLTAAQRDADAAAKTGAAEGHYAAGRIAETLGQVDAAIASYRAALAAHGKPDSQGNRYRMALARVLLLPRGARPTPPAAPPKDAEKVGWRDPAPYPAKVYEERKGLVLMLVLGLQPPLLPGEEPGLDEAEKLADEVLKAPLGTVPFTTLAQALAIKGRWNLALQVYVEGIRPILPREYYDGLMYLILNDPRLKRPDSLRIPNPLAAEKHFAAGLNFYFDGDYVNAERSFLLTIENDSQDARFFYFLGLSRLAQNRRREAYADFNQGVVLERINRPAPVAVDQSLERIQGPARCILNEFRQNPER